MRAPHPAGSLREFHNRLRILASIDADEFRAAVFDAQTETDWALFRADPWRWFITASDADAGGLFSLIQRREGVRGMVP